MAPGRVALLTAICGLSICAAIPAVAHTSGKPRKHVHTIIVHTVSGPQCEGGRVVYSGAPGDAARWKRFFDTHPFLGIHYVVDRAGRVLPSTPEEREANHALHNNEGAIGIELVHNGDGIEPFSDRQIDALIELIRSIRSRHAIPVENVKSHAEVDRRTFVCGGRQVKSRPDPGANFPWRRLRQALKDDEPDWEDPLEPY
jgi:N-acetyl-anhydromuramyl-L-alanine amidase AmpD